jgi:hypothetical protein
MTSRRNGLGLGVALSLGSLCLSFGAPAFAQDEPAPGPTPAAPAASDDAPAKPADAPAGTPAVEPAVDPAKAAKEAAPPEPVAPPTETTATGTSVERESIVSMIGIEQLPGSAYPAVQTRGIKYGSLWLTFHGQQWPYMPMTQGKPGLRIGFSGSLWNDLSYAHIKAEPGSGQNDQTRWTTQTRGVLRVTPTYNAAGGWFAQGNAEFVVHGDMQPDPVTGVLASTDDLFVRVGKWNVFDVTVGRFQGWEIANHFGMGLDQNTLERQGAWIQKAAVKPTDGYGLSYFWDRQDYLLGAYAVHVYPTKYLRAEVLGHLGSGSATSVPYQLDIRPSAIFDIGWLKLKAGLEYGKAKTQDSKGVGQDTKSGYGFAAQFVINPWVEFGGSFARGFHDSLDTLKGQPDLAGSDTVSTYGGFVNASPGYEPLVFGFGAFNNTRENMRINNSPGANGKVDTNDQFQIFGAAQYTLWQQFYIKFVLSHASNAVDDFTKGTFTNSSISGRLRLMLLF